MKIKKEKFILNNNMVNINDKQFNKTKQPINTEMTLLTLRIPLTTSKKFKSWSALYYPSMSIAFQKMFKEFMDKKL